jgi:hypothetical protein
MRVKPKDLTINGGNLLEILIIVFKNNFMGIDLAFTVKILSKLLVQ